jgi:hypothetical protein
MSKTTNRDTATRTGDTVDDRLARLLDTPFLARIVPRLAPETLHQLIQHRGLDACGELVTAATPAQLTSLLDLDLWRRAQPGRDEQFDVDRFGEWLEVLVDSGDSVAARTVATLDSHLVIAGLSRYVRVFDAGTFEPHESSDDETVDRHEKMNSETNSDGVECEVGGYLVRARRTDAWDAIVALLVTLDAEHNHYFHAVMRGCRRLSDSTPEVDGLDELLTAPEQHLHDAALERQRRRSRQGYTAQADARAFLELARQPRQQAIVSVNVIAAAYFRAAEEESDPPASPPDNISRDDANDAPAHGDADTIPASIEAIVELLTEAAGLRQDYGGQAVMPERPRALLEAADADPRAVRLPLLRRLMEYLLHHDEAAYLARSQELAFLANTLQAGASVQRRAFTPREASDAAASICNLGLECWQADSPDPSAIHADTFLVDHGLVPVFEAGWRVLYQDVSLFAADRLLATLAALQHVEPDAARGLYTFQRQLAAHRAAGTPWLARDAADVLARVDAIAWISVLGLLDECPIVPETITAVLERRKTPVSPTAFEFISTKAQIGDVHVFMRMLPDLLSR